MTKRVKVFSKSIPVNVDCNPVHSRLVTRIQIKNVIRGKTILFNMYNFIKSIDAFKGSAGDFIV